MSGEGWAPFVGAVLGRWHGAGPGRLEIPENPEILQAVERLAGQPAPARPRLLELLRRELERPLGQWLHPSWLLPCLPRDPLLRGWVLAGLPAEVRHPLLQALGGEAEGEPEEGVSVLAYQAPDGFGEWWNGELECLLAYPRPLPWSEEGASALGRLYRLSPRDLVRLLQFHGLRPLAAALASWGQERRDLVIAAAFHLPEILRRRLVERTQESSLAEV
ncbi:MAG TPA: hypothetical protein VLX28_02975, partial [Thermoanaerobaculia bacterium]|nr:hypothetical protein [Thermoanaerobaculia bacterium]